MERYFTIPSDHVLVGFMRERAKSREDSQGFALFYNEKITCWVICVENSFSEILLTEGAVEKTKKEYAIFWTKEMHHYVILGNENLAIHLNLL